MKTIMLIFVVWIGCFQAISGELQQPANQEEELKMMQCSGELAGPIIEKLIEKTISEYNFEIASPEQMDSYFAGINADLVAVEHTIAILCQKNYRLADKFLEKK
ncbi:MAG: hypothetical protein HOE90_17950 [Bacteriovoracaceae bacterium]|jgi:hypothetical protein|nr:hypothetical protein [Bacteriovoracaceae bacterium]